MENPFGEIETPNMAKEQPTNSEKINLDNKEEHIEKPFKGELTLDEPLKETIVIFNTKIVLILYRKGM